MHAILVATCTYFGLVFGTGFLLGTLRVLFLLPALGERKAELLEAPFMLVAILLAARHVVRRFPEVASVSARIAVGSASLIALLVVEFSVVLWLREQSIHEYLENRDPIAGAVYISSLLIFALAPAAVGSLYGRQTGRSTE